MADNLTQPLLIVNTEAQVAGQIAPSMSQSDTASYAANQTLNQTLVLRAGQSYSPNIGFSTLVLNTTGPVQLLAALGANPTFINQTVNQTATIDTAVDSFSVTNNGTASVTVKMTIVVTPSTVTPPVGVVTSVNGLIGNINVVAGPGVSVTSGAQAITVNNTGVISINGQTGNVSLTASNLSYGTTTVASELDSLSAQLNRARTITTVVCTSAGQLVYPIPGGYPVGFIDVYAMGAHQINGFDYSATDGLNLTMTPATAARIPVGAHITIQSLSAFSVADAVTLEQLGGTSGATLVGYGSQTVSVALDALGAYQAPLTGAISRPLDSKLSDTVSVLDFADSAGAWKTDSTAMFNLAITAINTLVNTQGFSFPVPAIEIPAGTYPITNTLSLFPWHRFVTRGSVVLDFTNLPVALNGIEVRNEQTTIPLGDMLFATKSPVLNGSQGSLCIRGPGKTVSTGFGLVFGNRTTNSMPVRDTGGRNVIVTGWGGALHYDPINLYLITWEGCRFEQNLNQCIHTTLPNGFTQVVNSGERMTFIDCTFAAAHNVLYHNCDGFDYQFVACSMDYNDAPFFFDTAGRYTNVKILGGHIEAFDGPIFDGSVAGQYIEIMISDWDVLPTHRTSATAIASPTRTMFVGNPANRMRLTINGMVVYYLHPPYLPDTPMIDDNVFILGLHGIIYRSYYPMTTRSRSLGRDYAFTANAVGTAGNALTYWVRDTGSNTFVDILANTIMTDPSTSALGNVMHLLGGGTDAAATFHTVETFPCAPGDVFYPQADAYAPTVTAGTIGVRVFQRFYDEAGVQLTPTSDFGTTYLMTTAFADTTLPNFSQGQNRWMAINGAVNVAPVQAASFRIYFTVTSFTGDLYVKNVRVIKG